MKYPRKRKDRLSRLWDNLLSDTVAPDPRAGERALVRAGLEGRDAGFPIIVPDLELPSLLEEPEISVTARSYAVVEENASGNSALTEEEPIETLLLSNYEADRFTTTDAAEPGSNTWRDSLESLFHSLVQLESTEQSPLSVEELNSESEAFSDVSVEASREESVSFSSPFRWEPKPAWIDTSAQSQPPYPNAANTGSRVYRSKLSMRPLHKQPFYRRLFFYMSRWLSRIFRKTA